MLSVYSEAKFGTKLERIKMPLNSGNIQDYPRFKNAFIKQVLPQIKSPYSTYIKILSSSNTL